MKKLPEEALFQSRTPDFDQDTVPEGILGQHKTAENTWGKIVVTEGELTYRILEPNVEEHKLDIDHEGIVAPAVAHQVQINGPVKFHVEFFRVAA